MSYSVPSVVTSIAAEGMGVTHGDNVLIADDGRSFAEALVKLYTDQVLWEKLSDNGWNFVNESFSRERAIERFNEIFKRIGKESLIHGAAPSTVEDAKPDPAVARRKRK